MNIEIKYHIREERHKRRLSLRDFSALCDVGKSQIANIENGLAHPTVPTLCMIAVALGVEPCNLFTMSKIVDK